MRQYTSSDLYDVIDTVSEIECSSCQDNDRTMLPNPEDVFFNRGWRATQNNVYCPVCAKIKLKIQ